MNTSNSSKASGKKKIRASQSQPIARKLTPQVLDFSSQPQPIPNQIQQFPPYQPQHFPNPNHQFSNPSQHHPYNFPYPPPYNYPYSQHPYNFSSTQSPPPYTNPVTEPVIQYDSQEQSPENVQPVFQENSPPINNDTDEINPFTHTGAISNRPYTHLEDICIANAYVTCTENPKDGRDQTAFVYWNDMTELYNKEGATLGLGKRDFKSIKNRLTRLKYEVQLYFEAEKHVNATRHSGWDQAMLLEEYEAQYARTNKRCNYQRFKCHHVIDIFRRCSKFDYVTTRGANSRNLSQGTESSPSTPDFGSNDSPDSSQQYHSGDKRSRCDGEDVTSPQKHPARPIGNKAAKKAARGKGKARESLGVSRLQGLKLSDETRYYLEEELSQKETFRAEKLKVFQEIADTSARTANHIARRLELDEKKYEQRERELQTDREYKILQMKLDTIEDEAHKELVRQMQLDIFNKWKNP